MIIGNKIITNFPEFFLDERMYVCGKIKVLKIMESCYPDVILHTRFDILGWYTVAARRAH